MRFFIVSLLSAFMFSLFGVSYANSNNEYTIPFNHVEVKAFSKMLVNYDLSSNRQLVCQTDSGINDGINSFTTVMWMTDSVWGKKGLTKTGLPVVLKYQREEEGFLVAEIRGQLIISNEFGVIGSEDTSTYVSCVYRNI